MTARLPTATLSDAAEAVAIQQWLEADIAHAVAAFRSAVYDRHAALHHVITFALVHAERAKIDPALARRAAVAEFNYALARAENHEQDIVRQMTSVAAEHLTRNPGDTRGAAKRIEGMAREARIPVHTIGTAVNSAQWRVRQAARG